MIHRGKQYRALLVEGVCYLMPWLPFKEVLHFVTCGGVPLTFEVLTDLNRLRRALLWYQDHPVKRRLRRILDWVQFHYLRWRGED